MTVVLDVGKPSFPTFRESFLGKKIGRAAPSAEPSSALLWQMQTFLNNNKIRSCSLLNELDFVGQSTWLKVVKQIIMVGMLEHRKVASGLLLPYQRFDFERIFHALDGILTTTKLP